MRQRFLLMGLFFITTGLAVVAVAQSPVAVPTITPPAPVNSAPAALPKADGNPPRLLGTNSAKAPQTTPLMAFERLSAFPQQTQDAVRAVLLGAKWMTRMNQVQGRFLFGYNPSLRQSLGGDHDLKQAQAAFALAKAAKFSGDEEQVVVASQAILAMLAATRIEPSDPTCRVPVHSPLVCNRVGFAATVALAIYELPGADPKLVDEAERLCEFLHKQCRSDGSVDYVGGGADATKVDPAGVNEHPAVALHAILAGNRVRPAAWKIEVAKKGLEHYRGIFRAKPHPAMVGSLTPAAVELALQTKASEASAIVFEMNDWLCNLQIPGNDPRNPQWAGGFRPVVDGQQTDSPPGPETGVYVQSLALACKLTRLTPDLDRYTRYKAATTDAVRFLTGLQYLDMNTGHFELTFRAQMLMGGFHLSPVDGNLRIDATALAVSGLVEFLGSGAEK